MVSGYAQTFKVAEQSASDHNEYSDPLQIAASAGARLSTPEKADISRKKKVQTNPEEKKSKVRG